MKKIVLMFMAVSLLLTGCSDGDEKSTSDSKENAASATETLTTESVTNVTVQPTEQKQSETESGSEKYNYEVKSDNLVNDSVSDSPNISQSMPENTTIPAGEQTVTGGENTIISSDELPVVGGEDKTVPENSDNKPSVTNNPSFEKKPQTTTIVSESEASHSTTTVPAKPIPDESHQTITTSKKSGGVIELPIIPVE